MFVSGPMLSKIVRTCVDKWSLSTLEKDIFNGWSGSAPVIIRGKYLMNGFCAIYMHGSL